MKFEEISLADLEVNPSNDRHGPKGSEAQAIQWLFDEHGPYMLNLAKDIVEQAGVLDAPLVRAAGDSFIVYDGNRRVTCLKVLAGLAAPSGSHANAVHKLAGHSNWKAPKAIPCQVEDDQNKIDVILNRRHNGTDSGRGQLKWDLRAKANHANRTGGTNQYPIAEATEVFLQKKGYPRVDKIKRSSLYRLINTKSRQARVGVALDESGQLTTTKDEASVVRLLARIADDIVDDRLTLANLLKVADIDRYLESLSEEGYDLSIEIPRSSISKTSSTAAETPNRANKKRKPRKRATLIPNEHAGIKWKERQGKIQRVWLDLQWNLKFGITELAIPILFRTLIELSTDYALKRLQQSLKDSLRKRVNTVAIELLARNELTHAEYKDLERLINDNGSYRELEALHRAVHSQTADPDHDDLRAMWDGFEPYLMASLKL